MKSNSYRWFYRRKFIPLDSSRRSNVCVWLFFFNSIIQLFHLDRPSNVSSFLNSFAREQITQVVVAFLFFVEKKIHFDSLIIAFFDRIIIPLLHFSFLQRRLFRSNISLFPSLHFPLLNYDYSTTFFTFKISKMGRLFPRNTSNPVSLSSTPLHQSQHSSLANRSIREFIPLVASTITGVHRTRSSLPNFLHLTRSLHPLPITSFFHATFFVRSSQVYHKR